jgi:hypothetical protein
MNGQNCVGERFKENRESLTFAKQRTQNSPNGQPLKKYWRICWVVFSLDRFAAKDGMHLCV